MNKKRYLWLTDTHLFLFNRFKMLNTILDQKPSAVFLTGDISEGPTLLSNLEFLGKRIGRPLYFVLGNHDIWGSSFERTYKSVQELCAKYKNLVWVPDNGIIPLSDEVALIGEDGWYSVDIGNPKYLIYTFDWFMIEELRRLPSMSNRVDKFKELAANSAKSISEKLTQAIETYKTVYVLTHVPPFMEANRCNSFISEKFWEPYNTNIVMGQAIEKVMEKNKKRNAIVLCGHIHQSMQIHVSRNIECRVGKGSYSKLSDEEVIYI